MAICLYPAECEDFSTNGLGLLYPLTCTVSEESGGMFELEMEHPIDSSLRWAQLAVGCIVKVSVPTRESPLYEEMEDVWDKAPVEITRNVWEVSGTTVGAYMRSGPGMNYGRHGYLTNGARVTEIGRAMNGPTVWLNVIVQSGGMNCWMSTKWLRQVGTVTETVIQGTIIGQRSVKYMQSRDQLFRIYSVERDAKEQTVTVKAMHIFYDLRGNLVNADYDVETPTEAREVLRGIFDKLATEMPFALHVAAGVAAKVKGDYGWKNPVECLLDPDEGVLPQAKALLLRDGREVYVLPDTTRDSGVTIRRGKNLKGVTVTEDASDIVTRIIPCGKDREGKNLFLDGTNSVDSPRIGDYPFPYVQKIDYDVKLVEKDADGETTFTDAGAARAKLRALAEADFAENGVDLPTYGMDVDFVLLQNTEEYADYAGLQAVFLHDTVTVIDSMIGLTAKVRVTGYRWDAVRQQYESVTLGELNSLKQTVYSYDLPTGGVKGSKIAPGSLEGSALRDFSVQYAKIAVAAIEQLTADSVTALTAKIQEIVSQQMTTDELYAALAALNRAVIEHADIQWADIESLQAAVAVLAQAAIGTADIGWAQIKDLLTGTAIITEGEAGKLMISRLAVTEANMVSLTTGELVVKGRDGRFYAVTVDEAGEIRTERKQVGNDDVADLSIDAGEKLVEGSVTAACLNATDIFADSAVIRQLIAANLDVDALFAREAFLQLLRTSKIVGDATLEIVVRDAAEAKEAVGNLQVGGTNILRGTGDIRLSGSSWSESTWGAAAGDAQCVRAAAIAVSDAPSANIRAGVRMTNPDGVNTWNGFAQGGIPAAIGQTYTLSCYARVTKGGGRCQCQIDIALDGAASHPANIVPVGANWTKCAYTYTVPANATNSHFGAAFYLSGTSGESTMEVCGMKLEVGNKATDWSPAPEDVDASIDGATGALAGQIGEVSGRVDECVTKPEQAVYLRQVLGKGVYVGFEEGSAQAFINAAGAFEVLVDGKSVTSLGDRVQRLGTLTFYESSSGSHAIV